MVAQELAEESNLRLCGLQLFLDFIYCALDIDLAILSSVV
eukprot:COSAG05_NODE_1370_length_5055_cov_1.930387_6_plen_40_part_00